MHKLIFKPMINIYKWTCALTKKGKERTGCVTKKYVRERELTRIYYYALIKWFRYLLEREKNVNDVLKVRMIRSRKRPKARKD